MMLGVRRLAGAPSVEFQERCYFSTVEHAGEVVACALRTPPFGLILTRAPRPALECLAEDLARKYESLPAALGPEPTVSTFAQVWSVRAGTRTRPLMQMRLFVAQAVRALPAQPSGALRLAEESDLTVVQGWMTAFHQEAHTGDPRDPEQSVREDLAEDLANQRLFVWDNGGSVSMAAWGGRTDRWARIGMAYTPPGHRGRGYASACVAALTQRLLDEGVAFCCINTDLTNATTNKIYPAIGYQPVCDISNIDLQAG